MSITSGLLTIVALVVVLRCSAVSGGTIWDAINNCLKEERNESMDAVQCVTTQMFVQLYLIRVYACGPCAYLFHCQAGLNAVIRCGNDDVARHLVTVVSECVDVALTMDYRAAVQHGRSGYDCEAAYGCRFRCRYSPSKGFCSKCA
ncbi:hypothetical protein NP493_678g01013 [Ridgeia piscesae]|uniref:Uncharacterized protein n=1 Tax=Ridgeia piscesae TaxID=27915 RepID=A0AAD9KR75_RIDPI|nr:hypothetical protein NP493_678g01013 [Ridgeia piscesae]